MSVVNPHRLVRRAGGPAPFPYVQFAGANCSSFCNYRMNPGGGENSFSAGWDPYFIRCYEDIGQSPQNFRRAAFVSQVGTSAIDPSLQQMNITDSVGCFCMLLLCLSLCLSLSPISLLNKHCC